MDLLPVGVYALLVSEVVPMHNALDDNNVFALHLENSEYTCVAYLRDTPKDRFEIWGDLATDFYDLAKIQGRAFLFPIKIVDASEDVLINVIEAPLAEILDV